MHALGHPLFKQLRCKVVQSKRFSSFARELSHNSQSFIPYNKVQSFSKYFNLFSKHNLRGFLANSKNELMQWRGVRCLSVRLSVNFCANRFFSQTNGRIANKLAHDGIQVSVHPGCAQGQGQGQRSRDMGTFVLV